MRCLAFDAEGSRDCQPHLLLGGRWLRRQRRGGRADGSRQKAIAPDATVLPYPFRTGDELLALTREPRPADRRTDARNERHWRSDAEIDAGLLRIWDVMQDCVQRGCRTEGTLPGGFKVRRRAAALHRDW
jgi:L-serine dehydratase